MAARGSNSKVGNKPITGWHNREGSRISQLGAEEAEGWREQQQGSGSMCGRGTTTSTTKVGGEDRERRFCGNMRINPRVLDGLQGRGGCTGTVAWSKGSNQSHNIHVWLQCYAIYV